MLRCPLALSLISYVLCVNSSTLMAQTLPENTPTPPITIKTFNNFDALRQGTEMKIAIVLMTPGAPSREAQSQFVRNVPSLQAEPISTHLELDCAEGFSFGAIHPPNWKAKKFTFSPERIQVFAPKSKRAPLAFLVTVRAADSLAPGSYTLQGKLTYRQVNNVGLSASESVPMEIPIRVVSHDAQAKKVYFGYEHSHARNVMYAILLLPVVVPAIVVAGAACLVMPGNC
jgi:hypothetical protein